jgi:ribonuclease III
MTGPGAGNGTFDPATLLRCEERIGYRFQDRDLLLSALTHASTKLAAGRSNERLEFLGDAILGAIASRVLFDEHPDFEEGRLTKARAQIVSRRSLAEIGQKLELQEFLLVGKMFATRAHIASSVLSNAVEALVAAVFLDGGLDAATAFVERHFRALIEHSVEAPGGRDWKSLLGQWAQTGSEPSPRYVVLSTAGADHSKTFEVCVALGRRRFRGAFGRSKKEAEQRAARLALKELAVL